MNTDIYAPKDQSGPLPFLMVRTPYGIDRAGGALNTGYKELADDGYIFVFQDIRGRYKSEGQFVMQRPARSHEERKDPKAIDEATDAYDTIEWLIKNVPNNNGRVGMAGTSYAALTATTAEVEPHPALKAIVEEPAAEVRQLELDRLDAMYDAAIKVLEAEHVTVSQGKVVMLDGEPLKDDAPVLRAIETLLKIQQRRAALLGLDAKTQHDMGIAEREIALAEGQGELLAGVMMRVLDALDLSAEQQARAVEVMPRELRAIEGGAA